MSRTSPEEYLLIPLGEIPGSNLDGKPLHFSAEDRDDMATDPADHVAILEPGVGLDGPAAAWGHLLARPDGLAIRITQWTEAGRRWADTAAYLAACFDVDRNHPRKMIAVTLTFSPTWPGQARLSPRSTP